MTIRFENSVAPEFSILNSKAVIAKVGKTYCILKPAVEIVGHNRQQEILAPYAEFTDYVEALAVLRKVNGIAD